MFIVKEHFNPTPNAFTDTFFATAHHRHLQRPLKAVTTIGHLIDSYHMCYFESLNSSLTISISYYIHYVHILLMVKKLTIAAIFRSSLNGTFLKLASYRYYCEDWER